jgi:hypothetical protein
LRDSIKVQLYDPFSQDGQAYLGSADIEVSFASTKKRHAHIPRGKAIERASREDEEVIDKEEDVGAIS